MLKTVPSFRPGPTLGTVLSSSPVPNSALMSRQAGRLASLESPPLARPTPCPDGEPAPCQAHPLPRWRARTLPY
eukprot:363531-Chlamydomonas_euryale.AAC.9